MAADAGLDNATRLEDWIPLDLKGKPLYHGIDETGRMNHVRPHITTVREQWNSVEQCRKVCNMVLEVINAATLSRDLRDEVDRTLQPARFWADQQRMPPEDSQGLETNSIIETYNALQLYTANAGYKKIFGYINQIFRKENVDERMIHGAVALVELLTIDVYNLRLDNYGLAQYYNFQGVIHRGMTVKRDVLEAFSALLKKPLKERNFSVPLAFVSTTANQKNIQEFLNTTEEGKTRLHWKIHIRELDPKLLASYRQQYPASIVSTICAMPISHVSEFPSEQEILLRGPLFQLLRIYEEQAGDHAVHVMEMVMLNANRDHCTELAYNYGKYMDQRILFGRMCAATKYRVCASLAEQYGLSEANDYARLYAETLALIGLERTTASLTTAHYDIWTTLRPSWIGASLRKACPEPYARRRETFSRASYSGQDLSVMEKIIDEEYDWQKSDWCNIPRLFGALHNDSIAPVLNKQLIDNKDNISETRNASGFTALHQAAYNNVDPIFVQKLIDLGAWRTMRAHQREGFRTAKDIAVQRSHDALIALLEPEIYHDIAAHALKKMETRVHEFMREMAGNAIDTYAVRLPQLSVMTEMDVAKPSLWVPIPSIHGGFVITLDPGERPSLHVIYVSHVFPKTERQCLINGEGVVGPTD